MIFENNVTQKEYPSLKCIGLIGNSLNLHGVKTQGTVLSVELIIVEFSKNGCSRFIKDPHQY